MSLEEKVKGYFGLLSKGQMMDATGDKNNFTSFRASSHAHSKGSF